jgi:hypothetical protein
MKILICGGRDPPFPANTVYSWLDRLSKDWFEPVIIEGDARGVDRMAGYWARTKGYTNLKFPAEWDKYGKRAGYLRNKRMLDEGKPDLVVAFPGGPGTAMMIKLAEEAGVKVIRIG